MANVIREYTLKLTTKEAEANLKKTNDLLQLQDDAINRIKDDLVKLEKQKKESYDSRQIDALNKKIARTKLELKDETNARQKLVQVQRRQNKELAEAKKNTADFSGAMKLLDGATGGAASKVVNLVGGVGKATKGFNLLKIAMMGAGFGIILGAITAVTAAFKSNEEGQGKLLKAFNRIKTVIGNVTDVAAKFGKTILSLGSFLGAKLTGNTEKANKAMADVKKNFNEATESVKNFGEETRKELELADKMTAIQLKNSKIERELVVDRAKANSEIAELRAKASDKENFTTQERIQALRDAAAIEDEITAKELELAKQRLEAKRIENSLSESTKEDLMEEAKLQAEVQNIETKRQNKKRMLTRSVNAAIREENAETKRLEDEAEADRQQKEDERLERERNLADARKEIRDLTALSLQEERDLEIQKLIEQYDKIAETEGLKEEELQALRDARDEAVRLKKQEFEDADLQRKQELADEEEKIEEQKRKSVMETFDNAARIAGEETKLGKALLIAKQMLLLKQLIIDAKSQLSTASKVVGEATMQGAEASTEVAGSVAKASNTAPPPANIPFIISAIATGAGIISSVKKAIQGTKKAASDAGASVSTPTIDTPVAPTTTAPEPPDITSVGGGTSQLAEAIGSQVQQPVQAFVVSSEVTTAQGLERNIVDSASIG